MFCSERPQVLFCFSRTLFVRLEKALCLFFTCRALVGSHMSRGIPASVSGKHAPMRLCAFVSPILHKGRDAVSEVGWQLRFPRRVSVPLGCAVLDLCCVACVGLNMGVRYGVRRKRLTKGIRRVALRPNQNRQSRREKKVSLGCGRHR